MEVFEEIGSGAVAKVFRGSIGDQPCAVKVLRALSKDQRKTLVKEYSVLKKLSHENIIKVKCFLEEKDSLVLDLCGIQLQDKVIIDVKEWSQAYDGQTQDADLQVSKQIVNGLNYLHDQDIIHCDLKPSNCLFTGSLLSPIVKLADFGIAYYQAVTHTETQMSQVCGEYFNILPNLN